jgi:iodotyrosine deiodinase
MQINGFEHQPYLSTPLDMAEVEQRARTFYEAMSTRRSVRHFSDRPVSRQTIQYLVETAASAPSGAHKQPWTFCVVSDPDLKRQIRIAAEQEEHLSYTQRMTSTWLEDLAPLGTDWQKPFLEIAPFLVVIFAQITGPQKEKHYYVQESVGIAAGLLITSIHQAGLVTLTHTPSPMNFLKELLGRPAHERPFLLLPVGYPAEDAHVPTLDRKKAEEVVVFYE